MNYQRALNEFFHGLQGGIKEPRDLKRHHEMVLKNRILAKQHFRMVQKTAEKIKEQFAPIPEELRPKKLELNRSEPRIHNVIAFIAGGRATASITDALELKKRRPKSFSSMSRA